MVRLALYFSQSDDLLRREPHLCEARIALMHQCKPREETSIAPRRHDVALLQHGGDLGGKPSLPAFLSRNDHMRKPRVQRQPCHLLSMLRDPAFPIDRLQENQ